jgi:hypothetical protein
MSPAWLVAPGLIGAGLTVMAWRRLISPTRFVQAIGAVALSVVATWGAQTLAGGGHG